MSAKTATPNDIAMANLGHLLPNLEALYKDIHSHPELSMQERRTSEIAASRLTAAGYQVTTGVGKTGVVGLLPNGDGPTVMLRADMDALPVREETGLPYASTMTATDPTGKTVSVMHACGHDMHVTWLVGAATLLAQAREDWHGTVENDPAATKRVADAFRQHFAAGRVEESPPTTASEDFGSFGAEWHSPAVFWFVVGTDPDIYAKAKADGLLGDLPTNHNPRFAPVIHPTLETGIETLVVAAQAWLTA